MTIKPTNISDETNRFLRLIDPDTEYFDFRAIHPKGDAVSLSSGSFEAHSEDLRAYNDWGYGIFVTINKTDGKGVKGENVTKIRAVWQDDDEGFKGEYLVEPSITVETSKGRYQRYWLLEGDMTPTAFSQVMERIVFDFGGDPNAKDLPRVLRLPGFNHTKDKPYPVRIVSASGKRYTEAELLEAFPPLPKPEMKPREADREPESWDSLRPRLVSALSVLDASDRDRWFRYGGAIFDASGGSDDGFVVWDAWAQTCPDKYSFDDNIKYWSDDFINDRDNKTSESTIFYDAKEAGWVEEGKFRSLPKLPDGDKLNYIPSGSITKTAMESVRNIFDERKHFPSEAQYEGLTAIAKAIEARANGMLDSLFYISSLAPGVGKSTVLKETVKCLLLDKDRSDVSVIIFLSRLTEIANYVREMELSEGDYAVLVSDRPENAEFNKLGNCKNRGDARVLFTTQQMLLHRSTYIRNFSSITEFLYKGQPRTIRLWDEAIMPAKDVTVSRFEIDALKADISKESPEFAKELDELSINLTKANDHDIFNMPDFSKHGFDREDIRSLFPFLQDKRKDTVSALWSFQGLPVRIRKDQTNNVLVGYEEKLPSGIAPLIILDASGNLRMLYHFWYLSRQDLHPLYSPPKFYDGFTIHHWNRGAGKTVHKNKKDFKPILDTVANLVNSDIPQDEDVLVVHLKRTLKIPDIQVELEILHKGRKGRLKYVTWGNHTATNEFNNIKHVILIHAPHYSVPQYEALGRGAKKLKTEEEFSLRDFNYTRYGETAHHIFQAACRGKVRQSEGDNCPSGCHMYSIFSTHKGMGTPSEILEYTFPGATVTEWSPLPKKLSQKQENVLANLISLKGHTIKKQELASRLNLQKTNLMREVSNPKIEYHLKARGLAIKSTRTDITIETADGG